MDMKRLPFQASSFFTEYYQIYWTKGYVTEGCAYNKSLADLTEVTINLTWQYSVIFNNQTHLSNDCSIILQVHAMTNNTARND
jgi:hypothetical protein